MHQNLLEYVLQSLIFAIDVFWKVLSIHTLQKLRNVPLVEKFFFLNSSITSQENHDHGALVSDLGNILVSSKTRFHFTFL
jgi:hypothetical protein